MGAHRAAWELTNGPIPADQQVLHRCDNPACCNPAHLKLGTHFDNMQDRKRAGRYVSFYCGEKHHNAKMTAELVGELRQLREEGWTLAKLATRYSISEAQVSNIARRKVWR
jgi:hypothetical protein